MISKKITYTDYFGNKREEEHFFHLKQSEVFNWLLTTGDYTLDKVLERLTKERNGKKVMEIFEDLLHRSYGRMSLDGRRFEKSEEIWKEFYETEAYSQLFLELVTDAKKAAAFVNGIIPKDITKEVEKALRDNPQGVPDMIKDYMPDVARPMDTYTNQVVAPVSAPPINPMNQNITPISQTYTSPITPLA